MENIDYKIEELEQKIARQESLIEEEQRCLNYCLNNPSKCTKREVKDRERLLGYMLEELYQFNELLEELNETLNN